MKKIIEDVILNHDILEENNRAEPTNFGDVNTVTNVSSVESSEGANSTPEGHVAITEQEVETTRIDVDAYAEMIVMRHSLINPNPDSDFNVNYPAQTELTKIYDQKFKNEELFDNVAKKLEAAYSKNYSGNYVAKIQNSQLHYRRNLMILKDSIDAYEKANKLNPNLELRFFKNLDELNEFKAEITASIASATSGKQSKTASKKMSKIELKREQEARKMFLSRADI